MTTIWILRFIPYAGGASVDALYRSRGKAYDQYLSTVKCDVAKRLSFVDDYGIELSFAPSEGSLLLTNTEASAEFNKDLAVANQEANMKRGLMPPKASNWPSSMQ